LTKIFDFDCDDGFDDVDRDDYWTTLEAGVDDV
jgi:hypothetical protein